MHVVILDGHPDVPRLTSSLLDWYEKALPPGISVDRFALRDLAFDVNLRRGYSADQVWEPDLQRFAAALNRCDHFVIGFPLWWGGEPALLKGLLDRILLPGFAFRYHRKNVFWDKLLAGRSADLIITMDTPPWYLLSVYGDPIGHRWRRQVLGFCGVKPIRLFRFGPTRRGQAAKRIERWHLRVAQAAQTAPGLKRAVKHDVLLGREDFTRAAAVRRS